MNVLTCCPTLLCRPQERRRGEREEKKSFATFVLLSLARRRNGGPGLQASGARCTALPFCWFCSSVVAFFARAGTTAFCGGAVRCWQDAGRFLAVASTPQDSLALLLACRLSLLPTRCRTQVVLEPFSAGCGGTVLVAALVPHILLSPCPTTLPACPSTYTLPAACLSPLWHYHTAQRGGVVCGTFVRLLRLPHDTTGGRFMGGTYG